MEKTPRNRRTRASSTKQPSSHLESGDEESSDHKPPRKPGRRPGPIYDTAFRALIEADPAAACRLFAIPVEQPIEILPATFVARRRDADLVLRTGPTTLAHFEYADTVRHDPDKTDLVTRMLGYRYAIMCQYPHDDLVQHIIVLGTGRVRGHNEFARRGFALDLHITHLAKMEPETILAEPSLAALASLARGNPAARARAHALAIAQALATGGEQGNELINFANMVATKNLKPNTIKKIYEEATMAINTMEEFAEIFLDTTVVQTAVRKAAQKQAAQAAEQVREQILEQVREQILEQGLVQGREQLLRILLQDRFGDEADIPGVARRLSTWPDPATALHAIKAAQNLTDLKD